RGDAEPPLELLVLGLASRIGGERLARIGVGIHDERLAATRRTEQRPLVELDRALARGLAGALALHRAGRGDRRAPGRARRSVAGDALAARRARPQRVGLALERRIVVDRDAAGLQRGADAAVRLLHDVGQL